MDDVYSSDSDIDEHLAAESLPKQRGARMVKLLFHLGQLLKIYKGVFKQNYVKLLLSTVELAGP